MADGQLHQLAAGHFFFPAAHLRAAFQGKAGFFPLVDPALIVVHVRIPEPGQEIVGVRARLAHVAAAVDHDVIGRFQRLRGFCLELVHGEGSGAFDVAFCIVVPAPDVQKNKVLATIHHPLQVLLTHELDIFTLHAHHDQ